MKTGTESILLVDDDVADMELTVHFIRQHLPTVTIIRAKNGEEAMKYIFHNVDVSPASVLRNLRLVIADLHMPVMDGFELLEKIKGNEHTESLPVVVLTSSRELKDVERCYRLRVNSYVVKPIDIVQFEHAVMDIVRYWMGINIAVEFSIPPVEHMHERG